MGPALKLQPGPGPLALNDALNGLDASQLRFAAADHLQLPSPALRIHDVHPEQVRGKQHGLLAAHAAPDLHHHVLSVIGVSGQQQNFQLLPQPLRLFPGLLHLLLRHFPQLRVPQQFLRGGQSLLRRPAGPVCLRHRFQFLLLPRQAAQQIRIGVGGRIFHLTDNGLQTLVNSLQLIEHNLPSPFLRPGRW